MKVLAVVGAFAIIVVISAAVGSIFGYYWSGVVAGFGGCILSGMMLPKEIFK
jgi:hypothetical protein